MSPTPEGFYLSTGDPYLSSLQSVYYLVGTCTIRCVSKRKSLSKSPPLKVPCDKPQTIFKKPKRNPISTTQPIEHHPLTFPTPTDQAPINAHHPLPHLTPSTSSTILRAPHPLLRSRTNPNPNPAPHHNHPTRNPTPHSLKTRLPRLENGSLERLIRGHHVGGSGRRGRVVGGSEAGGWGAGVG